MIEHVGVRNYPVYMRKAFDLLDPGERGAFFLCHGVVGLPTSKNPFIDKYIFPGGELGATWEIQRAAEAVGFVTEDWENFGNGYHLTLREWHRKFIEKWDEIEPLIGSDILRVFGTVERFKRAWVMYLLGFAARFQTRVISVGQFIFSKDLIGQRYEATRL
jgi:cyclopropane-fatty-acyl-phospholipid synthase